MYPNIEIIEFKKNITAYVEKSPLPEEVKRMVLEDILVEQEKKTVETLKREIAERDKKEAEESAESV